MKFLKPFLVLTFFATSILLIGTGCDDDDKAADIAKIEFNFNYNVNGATYNAGDIYMINGTAVSFDLANFYIGGIEFQPETGNPISVNGLHLLVNSDQHEFNIAEVGAGQYSMLKFFVGVGLEENNQSEEDFTVRTAGDPLAAQDPSMAWPWGAGYKFARIDGMVDTDADGVPDTGMQFHIGDPDPTDQDPKFRKSLEFDLSNDLVVGDNILEINVDLALFFQDIDLSTNFITHVGDNVDLANTFFSNFDKAFSVN